MIFAPQNVAGPANRGGVIQQLAQGAAQNVMRRQKLKALLQTTAGQAAGSGAAQPFRASTMGHATGVRGAVMRPAGAAHGGLALTQLNGAGGGGVGVPGLAQYADPGQADLPSLPGNDPTQSPVSTAPIPVMVPPDAPNGAGASYPTPQTAQAAASSPGAPGVTDPGSANFGDASGSGGNVTPGWIPLGGGVFYDPVNDIVRGGGGTASAGQTALAGRPV